MQVVNSPLAPQYFSETPYLLGDRAIKFSARPCAPRPSPPNAWSLSGNRLREAMAAELAQGDACFDFLVQMQGDPSRMPGDDSTGEWGESESPFVKVARLEIPAQVFDTPARHQTCENLSFNPWHALPEHRPLGNLNRARRAVYDASSKLRHTLNVAPRQEPVDLKVPGE